MSVPASIVRAAAPRRPGRADAFWPRLAEFLALYAGLPLVLFVRPTPGVLIPGLVAGAAACIVVLRRDPSFDRRQLLSIRAIAGHARSIVALAAVGAAAMFAGTAIAEPDRLLWLPRHRAALWAVIMVGYPLLSVYPQEVIYRAFLMHRYRAVFPGRWTMIAASAAAFGFGHIMFQNWLAIVMTFAGGALFAWRYDRSRSLAAVWLEHALWGCLIFTIGLGTYFFLGAVALRGP